MNMTSTHTPAHPSSSAGSTRATAGTDASHREHPTPQGSQPGTQSDVLLRAAGDSPAHPKQVIDSAREEIDTLDARIIELVRERMAVSARIQRTRMTTGGRRVNLSREMEILSHYRAELGKPGTSLAMTLLELSRGRG